MSHGYTTASAVRIDSSEFRVRKGSKVVDRAPQNHEPEAFLYEKQPFFSLSVPRADDEPSPHFYVSLRNSAFLMLY